jgi:hypothetical protein
MPRGRYVDASNWTNDHQAAGRANAAAGRVDAGSAQLNNFNNTSAAQHVNQVLGKTQHDNSQYIFETNDERDQYQQNFERSLQDRAMGNKEAETRLKYASQDKMSAAMGRMGGGLLGGLTTNSAQRPAVSLFGSSGRRIGGTPLSGLA